jgi:ABC-type cobalamin transport system permease subunit
MFQQTKLGNILGALSFVATIVHLQKKGEKTSKVIVTGAAFGLCGYFIGNAITKFYE